MIRSAFGATLRNLRLEAAWRQIDLAQDLGMARSTIANVEAGREPPTLRLWNALAARHSGWVPQLEEARTVDLAANHGAVLAASPPSTTPALGGPFVLESLTYAYIFEHSRSPSEIIEARRVRATKKGAKRFVLSFNHTTASGFTADERSLWGGHLGDQQYLNISGQTRYLRTFEFDRTLDRGQHHDFATRSFVEDDPEPQTVVCFNLTIPAREVHIHLSFLSTQQAERAWSFGPVVDADAAAADPAALTELDTAHGTVSAHFTSPEVGPDYGVSWSWC